MSTFPASNTPLANTVDSEIEVGSMSKQTEPVRDEHANSIDSEPIGGYFIDSRNGKQNLVLMAHPENFRNTSFARCIPQLRDSGT